LKCVTGAYWNRDATFVRDEVGVTGGDAQELEVMKQGSGDDRREAKKKKKKKDVERCRQDVAVRYKSSEGGCRMREG